MFFVCLLIIYGKQLFYIHVVLSFVDMWILCLSVSLNAASADGIPKSVAFNTKRTPRPLTIMKPKTSPPRLSVTLKSQRAPKPSSMAEKLLESQVNLKENYSYNWWVLKINMHRKRWFYLPNITSQQSYNSSFVDSEMCLCHKQIPLAHLYLEISIYSAIMFVDFWICLII